MKKILTIVTMSVTLFSLSTFGQGYFSFTSSTRAVWDDWSGLTPRNSTNQNVAFLFNYTGSGLTRLVDGIGVSTPTNSAAIDGAAAWSAILNDPNYHFATNANTGVIAIDDTSAAGAVNYLGATFPVVGTSSAGGTVNVFAIAWSSQYANPFLAAAANSPVGWSLAFLYSYGNISGTVLSFSAQGGSAFPFGVAPVPEPTTMALAGLGAASLLIFRRRKQ